MHETDGLNSNGLAERKVRKCKQAKNGIFLQNKTWQEEGKGEGRRLVVLVTQACIPEMDQAGRSEGSEE